MDTLKICFVLVGDVSVAIEAVEIIDGAKGIQYKLQGGGKLSNVDEGGMESLEFVVTSTKELQPGSIHENHERANEKQKTAHIKSNQATNLLLFIKEMEDDKKKISPH